MYDRLQLLPRYVGIAAGARLFALLAIGLPSVWLPASREALTGILLLGVVWTGATTLSVLTRVPALVALVGEGALVTLIVSNVVSSGIADTQMLQLTALAVTPFIAGLRRGPRGVVEVLAAEAVVLAVTIAVLSDRSLDATEGAGIFTALVMGLGVGLVSSFLRSVQDEPDDLLTPYRDARALILRLLDLSDDLGQGLDPVSIADRIAYRFGQALQATAVTVYVERYGEFVPLLNSPAAGGVGNRRPLVDRARSTSRPVLADGQVALPLATDAGVAGVVVGLLDGSGDTHRAEAVDHTLHRLERELAAEALRLDTAQLFARVREAATSQERQRLAREVHDGVAQGVASLGYLVDALAADATEPVQRDGLQLLRASISDVVGEIRRTVFSLRNEATAGQRLGQRIRTVADNLEATSGMRFETEVEESAERLLHEVEADLLRIAQEAMNNAVKHSGGGLVRVALQVDAPRALLSIDDDGVGLGGGQSDSQGLRIMRERAARIGATIDISDTDTGAAVLVRVGRDVRSIAPVSGATIS